MSSSVALHEIRHALGLRHSDYSFDTMYPFAPPYGLEFPLTSRDLNTVSELYLVDERNPQVQQF
jgi:predicted Zn-dependent protease